MTGNGERTQDRGESALTDDVSMLPNRHQRPPLESAFVRVIAAAKLREAAGLPKEPTGVVAQNSNGASNGHGGSDGVMEKVKDAIS